MPFFNTCLRRSLLPAPVVVMLLLTACHNKPRFERLDPNQTGISFANTITESDSLNVLDFEYVYNGGGVGVGDVNNDELVDIYFSGNQVPGRLYHAWSTGVSLVDINTDGRLDLYVCTISPKRGQSVASLFYINEGIGPNGIPHFSDRAVQMGLADRGYSTQAAFFDYDRDGDLDVYLLTNALESYNRNQPRGPITNSTGRSTDRLYRNDSGQFTNVSAQAGITVEGRGLGVVIADLNEDGWPDVYCANDFQSNDLLWINNQDGTFTNRLTEYVRHGSYNAMGVDVADLNNDGHPELMTLDMMPDDNWRQKSMFGPANPDRFQMGLERGYAPQYVWNALQLNPRFVSRGAGSKPHITFSEVGQLAGVSATDWSWSTLMADFDNDGYRDIFITNGYPKDITDLDFVAYSADHGSSYFTADTQNNDGTKAEIDALIGVRKSNFMYHNRGGSLVFDDVTEAWGLSVPLFSNGATYADLDNDGDLDIVVNNINDPAFVYANRTVEQQTGGTNPAGSTHYLRVKLVGEAGNPAGFGASVSLRYGSNGERRQVAEQSPYRGYKSTVEPILHFGLGAAERVDTVRVRWPDGRVSVLTNVVANQVLTVRQASAGLPNATPGRPGSSVVAHALFTELTTDNPLRFVQQENPFIDFKEQTLLPHQYSRNGPGMAVGDVNGDGLDDVFMGGASTINGTLFRQQPNGSFSPSAVAGREPRKMADDMDAVFFDADGDGDQDLYVVSGGNEWLDGQRYYQDQLFLNTDGRGSFRQNTTALPNTRGSGSCVVAADYDHDGDLDLFVGGRLTPRRYPLPGRSYLLQNNGGKFTDVTNRLAPGLANVGMVTAALWSNYDNDSDMDYVAGNLGLNSRYRVSASEPLQVYAKDFDQNGPLDPIMCHYIQGNCYPSAPRDQVAVHPLPMAAQLAPVTAMLTGDFDGDGRLVLLTGNAYATDVEVGRYDAGKGLLRQGNGRGNFWPLTLAQSGFCADRDAKSLVQMATARHLAHSGG